MTYCNQVTMELLSDTIFGSGHSIPGGEDIAVRKDRNGYPFLAGETFKGLLRSEVENWLDWTQPERKEQVLLALFGESGCWTGNNASSPVFVTPFVMQNGPANPEDCFSERAFTAMEQGIVKRGSLRLASCVRRGLCFSGTVTCETEDDSLLSLLDSALRCIKFVGTDRNRGFGKVRVQPEGWTGAAPESAKAVPGAGDFLLYRLSLLEPVRLTDRASSYDTFLLSRQSVPGSAIRGAVLHTLANRDSAWFEAHKRTLLKQVYFCDALPEQGGEGGSVIPTPKGFYEDKLGKQFYHFLSQGEVLPGTKRASLGSFSRWDEETGEITSWSPVMKEQTRINLTQQKQAASGGMLQTEALDAMQQVSGMVVFPKDCPDEVRRRVAEAMTGQIRLGASVHSGCGLCTIEWRTWAEEPPQWEAYSFRTGAHPGTVVDFILLSPLELLDEAGEPRGIVERKPDGTVSYDLLSQWLGVSVTGLLGSTSVSELGGFNRTLGCRLPTQTQYDPGCTFRVFCDSAPTFERLRRLERDGVGLHRETGCGRILFLRSLDRICAKAKTTPTKTPVREDVLQRKRERAWLASTELPGGLSASQMGELENRIMSVILSDTPQEDLDRWFQQVTEKSPAFAQKYAPVRDFVSDVLTSEQIPAQTQENRLRLLVELIRLDRKEGM